MTEAAAIRDRQRSLLRLVRRLVWLGVLGGLAFFSLKYDLDTIPEGYEHLEPQHMRGGATVVTKAFDPEEAQVGNVVLYRAPAPFEGHCYGVIAALPGDEIEIVESRPGAGSLVVHPKGGGEERREQLPFPTDMRLANGVVPAGRLLVLNGDRLTQAAVQLPDGRSFGLVPIENVERRLVTALNPFQ